MRLDATGQPVYGDRDQADLAEMRALKLPFWLAGSYARPERVVKAIEAGAAGVQVGTAFAYCDESGLDADLKRRVLAASRAGSVRVFTDPIASPAGFPFKVVQLDDTLSDQSLYKKRTRVCDLAYLRHAYKRPDGTLGWRCPAEPEGDYLRKGGQMEDTHDRKCLCNALLTNIGLGQLRGIRETERPLITSGEDVADIARFLRPGTQGYAADDVIQYLLPEGSPANRKSCIDNSITAEVSVATAE
jgi:NAD(P)H-dependent flavin oxidoreductase YrpB (nitropropane dioxygenase family)